MVACSSSLYKNRKLWYDGSMTYIVYRDLRAPVSVKPDKFHTDVYMRNLYDVDLGMNNVVAYQKFSTLGIGLNYEPLSTNMSLPYGCPAQDIAAHIMCNAGHIERDDVIGAILAIQDAINEDQLNGVFNMRIEPVTSGNGRILNVQDSGPHGMFSVDMHDHTLTYTHNNVRSDTVNLLTANLDDVMECALEMNPRFQQYRGALYELASQTVYAYFEKTTSRVKRDHVHRLTSMRRKDN